MRKKIDIAQFASGSWPDNIGDTTLFYSAGYSRHANDVSGLFLDNPPVLSPRYASVAWLYHADVDKYLFMHVQGSHVVNVALGRNYPFRAGYEVSRDDMNQINYSLRALLSQMPRIQGMASGRVESAHYVDVPPQSSSAEAICLMEHIEKAMITGRSLYLPLPVEGDTYRCDGVLESPELQVLLAAIEQLPLHLRRYATFAFSVDEHYSAVLNEALVVVYVSDSKLEVPSDALHLPWRDAISSHAPLSREELATLGAIQLPGADGKLLSYGEMKRSFSIYNKRADELQADEWHIWLTLGHRLSDLHTDGWDTLRRYAQQMDDDTRRQYFDLLRSASLQWPIETLDEQLYTQMGYNDEERYLLQGKALKDYLLSEGRHYGYLFDAGGLNEEQKTLLTGQFVERLHLTDRGSIERWHTIFEAQGRMNNTGVRKAFARLYETHVVPDLKTMGDIVSCMRHCPFVNASAFKKPDRIVKPEGLSNLSEEHQALIARWVDEAVGSIRFKHIDEVLHVLHTERDRARREKKKSEGGKSLEAESLQRLTADELRPLLQRGSGGDEGVFERCDLLLSACKDLPTTWDDFVINSVIKACNQVLFGGKNIPRDEVRWPSDQVHDIANWPKLGKFYARYPHAAVLIAKRIEHIGSHDTADTTARKLKDTFSRPTKKSAKSEDTEAERTPYKKAEDAYPIIKSFLTTYKKQNRKMAKEIEQIFKNLKSAKSDKKRRLHAWLYPVIGLAVGLIVGAGGMLAYHLMQRPEKVAEPATQLVLTDDQQENLLLRIADLGSWETISKVVIDTTTVKDVNLNDVHSLNSLSEAYYKNPPIEIQPAKAVVHDTTSKEGTAKGDTLNINAQAPLLRQVLDKPLQIDQVLVNDSVKVTVPAKELFGDEASKLTSQDARYYLRVIKYLRSKLPETINIAY